MYYIYNIIDHCWITIGTYQPLLDFLKRSAQHSIVSVPHHGPTFKHTGACSFSQQCVGHPERYKAERQSQHWDNLSTWKTDNCLDSLLYGHHCYNSSQTNSYCQSMFVSLSPFTIALSVNKWFLHWFHWNKHMIPKSQGQDMQNPCILSLADEPQLCSSPGIATPQILLLSGNRTLHISYKSKVPRRCKNNCPRSKQDLSYSQESDVWSQCQPGVQQWRGRSIEEKEKNRFSLICCSVVCWHSPVGIH